MQKRTDNNGRKKKKNTRFDPTYAYLTRHDPT